MKQLIALLLFIAPTVRAFAQQPTFEERFFFSLNTSTYFDIVRSPLEMQNSWVGDDPNPDDPTGPGIPRFVDVPYQSISWSIFSFGVEPRYNIMELDKDGAIAVSVPVSFGFGQVAPASEEVRGAEGVGSIQVPLLLKLYIGHGSTYQTEKDFGISVGGGLEFNRVGLINLGTSDDAGNNKAWTLPVGTVGFHFWRGTTPMEINFKYGAGKFREYAIDKNGNAIRNDANIPVSKRARASSFKLSFVYLLNY